MTCCFFGHRDAAIDYDRLKNLIEKLIVNGYDRFLVGRRGNFDLTALTCCQELKKRYPNIHVCLVLVSMRELMKFNDDDKSFYDGIEFVIYQVENVYFKRQITFSNEKMIDESDIAVCYVCENRHNSGALYSLNYAKKAHKKIINLYYEDLI